MQVINQQIQEDIEEPRKTIRIVWASICTYSFRYLWTVISSVDQETECKVYWVNSDMIDTIAKRRNHPMFQNSLLVLQPMLLLLKNQIHVTLRLIFRRFIHTHFFIYCRG